MAEPTDSKKKPIRWATAWDEARALIWARRGRLAIGLLLTGIARVSGLVLPATSKVLIDNVIGQGRHDLLTPLALAAGAATVVQAITSFLQSQVLGIAAQRAITEMRRSVHEHIMRLPVGYFDKTQSGILISRVMTDAEGIRNLVGTGLVQLFGSLITAVLALGVLLYLNWRLTLITIVVLGAFGGIMGYAFKYLRPMFRERGKLQAEVTGRLSQSLGGIRVVKAYTAEKREEIVFAKGAHAMLRNVAKTMTGTSATFAGSTVIVGVIGVIMIIVGGQRHHERSDDARRPDHVSALHRHAGVAGDSDRVDRHVDHRSVRGARSHRGDQADGHRGCGRRVARFDRSRARHGRLRRTCGSNTRRTRRC